MQANWALDVAWVGLLRLPMTMFCCEACRCRQSSDAVAPSSKHFHSHLKTDVNENYREFEKYCRTADEVWIR